jgi:hypothetical protein
MRLHPWFAVVFASLLGGRSIAQNEAESPEATSASKKATLALVDKFPLVRPGARYDAVIFRELGTQSQKRDVILLERSAVTPEVLGAAVRALGSSRLLHGKSPTAYRGKRAQLLSIGVLLTPSTQDWMRRYGSAMQRLVDSLNRAPTRTVPNVGVARALDFYPPVVRAPRR